MSEALDAKVWPADGGALWMALAVCGAGAGCGIGLTAPEALGHAVKMLRLAPLGGAGASVRRAFDRPAPRQVVELRVWATPEEAACWEALARRDGREGWGCEPTPEEAAAAAVQMLLRDPSYLREGAE